MSDKPTTLVTASEAIEPTTSFQDAVAKATASADITDIVEVTTEIDAPLTADEVLKGLRDALAGNSAFKQALLNRLNARAPLLRKIPLKKAQDYVVTFGPKPVPPFNSITDSVSPYKLFRGEKIINTGDTVGLFIQSLLVGNRLQFPYPPRPIPVTAFNPRPLDSGIKMDTCDPALFITFQIQNVTAATLTWSTSIFGKAVIL